VNLSKLFAAEWTVGLNWIRDGSQWCPELLYSHCSRELTINIQVWHYRLKLLESFKDLLFCYLYKNPFGSLCYVFIRRPSFLTSVYGEGQQDVLGYRNKQLRAESTDCH